MSSGHPLNEKIYIFGHHRRQLLIGMSSGHPLTPEIAVFGLQKRCQSPPTPFFRLEGALE